jgi:hypothetical protein
MRILLDQNVPRALRNLLLGHDVRTAAERGWSTLLNGFWSTRLNGLVSRQS